MGSRQLPDFDTLVAMHKDDPAALERVRTDMAAEIFEKAPEDVRRRLEGLQFRINMELRRAKTPEARCVKLSNMMHESFAELNYCLQNPYAALSEPAGEPARILPLRSPQSRSLDS